MKRLIFSDLVRWADQPSHRKPLLIRGARQVGKTWLVRALGETFSNFVEINFEFEPRFAKLFESDLDPHRIVREIAVLKGMEIVPGKTLLFFDEIQEAPLALQSMRYFYERMSDLALVAAGSLIEFVLEHTGLPVGRVDSIYLHPLSFLEFLSAVGESALLDELLTTPSLSSLLHQRCLELFDDYLYVGGMPEVVSRWVAGRERRDCRAMQEQLIAGYRADFHKYAKKSQYRYLELLFEAIPQSAGKKFVFSHVGEGVRKRELDPCLDLLLLAGVVTKVMQSSSRTAPLAAMARPDRFKLIMGDIGLLGAIARTPAFGANNQGALAESIVGQECLAYSNPHSPQQLYYWHREERSASAEVDYLIERDGAVLPIEVKSGDGRSLRSLRRYLEEAPPEAIGYRVSRDNTAQGENIRSIPLYALFSLFRSEISRLLD